ncbi:hypothetical protein WME75_31370 [Sorangium sp. So ce1014]|uniref:hypothetical protein n=1 Tax=Sorangium sp. So ce1014 TaxID=3133326 RepID=UPI003F629297
MSLVLAAPPAQGQAPTGGARLSYTRGPGAEGCADEQALRDVIAAQLGGTDPFVDGGGRQVEVVLRRKGRHFLGEIALLDSDGRRLGGQELTSATCGALVEDVGTALAIVLRPVRSAREPAPSPPAPPAPASPAPPASALSAPAPPEAASVPAPKDASPRVPAPAPPCPPAAPARPVERRSPAPAWPRFQIGVGAPPAWPRFQISVGALIAGGFAPAPAVGFSGVVGARWEAFSLSLEGRIHLPVAAQLDGGALLEVSWLGGSIVPCGHVAWFFGCGLATAGRVRHAGTVNLMGEMALPYAELGLRTGLEVPISPRLAAQLSGELFTHVIRPIMHISGAPSWSATAISAAGDLRLVASF